jgi:hypothetical protein
LDRSHAKNRAAGSVSLSTAARRRPKLMAYICRLWPIPTQSQVIVMDKTLFYFHFLILKAVSDVFIHISFKLLKLQHLHPPSTEDPVCLTVPYHSQVPTYIGLR